MPGTTKSAAMTATDHRREKTAITTNIVHTTVSAVTVTFIEIGKSALTTTAKSTRVSAGNPDLCESTASRANIENTKTSSSDTDPIGPSNRYSWTTKSAPNHDDVKATIM